MYTFVYIGKEQPLELVSIIKNKFNIHYTGNKFHTQYTELHNGKYAKTFVKDGVIDNEYITYDEYTSALAHITLTQKPIEHNNPIQDSI